MRCGLGWVRIGGPVREGPPLRVRRVWCSAGRGPEGGVFTSGHRMAVFGVSAEAEFCLSSLKADATRSSCHAHPLTRPVWRPSALRTTPIGATPHRSCRQRQNARPPSNWRGRRPSFSSTVGLSGAAAIKWFLAARRLIEQRFNARMKQGVQAVNELAPRNHETERLPG